MAKQRVCDICGKICEPSGRYTLVHNWLFGVKKLDICFDCVKEIKEKVKKK